MGEYFEHNGKLGNLVLTQKYADAVEHVISSRAAIDQMIAKGVALTVTPNDNNTSYSIAHHIDGVLHNLTLKPSFACLVIAATKINVEQGLRPIKIPEKFFCIKRGGEPRSARKLFL